MAYLDKTGLTYFWSKIKTQLGNKSDKGHTHTASEVSGLKTVATTGSYNDLSNKPIASGALTAPLTVTGGAGSSAGKIKLDEANLGQITNSDTSTLFGFLNTSDLSVGSTSYNLKLRGKGTRPQFNGNNMALSSDVPSSLPANGGNADTVDNKHIVVSSSAPTTNDTNIITFVV